MKNFINFDWLRVMQFFSKTVQKRVNTVQKEETNLALWLVNDQRNLQMGQSNLLFSNQAHALDGAIDGVIFSWLRDTRAFLLFYHFEFFSCILLISNHMIFLVQFGINKHYGLLQFCYPLENLLLLIYSKLHSKSCDYL